MVHFSSSSIVSSCLFLGTATAFAPARKLSPSVSLGLSTIPAEVVEPTETTGRPIRDPLGLYPEASPERQMNMIQPVEPAIEKDTTVFDPMNLYPKGSVANNDSAAPDMSASLPFVARPALLDGSLAGDRGFDPFGFSQSKGDLMRYRDAEIKHSRLAMLAAAGWPMAELFDRKIASMLDLKPLLVFQDRVPSILNGGLGRISPVYWVSVLAMATVVEAIGYMKANEAQEAGIEVAPGDLGFDPLGLYGSTPEERKYKEEAEIFHGRLSMLAIVGFAAQEWWTSNSVINETPFFFKPITEVLAQMHYVDADLLP